MKKILFFILVNYFMSAQNTFIEYKVKIGYDPLLAKGNPNPEMFESAKKNAENLNFGLIIKDETSYFYSIDNSLDDDLNLSKIIAFYKGATFRDKKDVYQQSNLLGNNIYVKRELNTNWKLENVTKKIDGYVCYKATTEYIVINPKGKFIHPVIAWYCPEISSQMGPIGYGGLPGLILEIQVRNVTYGAIKIDVKSEKDFEIRKDKMNIITEEELNKKLKEL